MKFNFKKVTSVLVSGAMLASTIGLVAEPNLTWKRGSLIVGIMLVFLGLVVCIIYKLDNNKEK